MKPIRLYINNFMCYDSGFIDFTQFNSALIVGKLDNNDLYSNGVGKTTIFKAIEYVLFNQSDFNLEKIVRDDINACQITLDFTVKNDEYRLVRKRTKKGVADLSLYQRITAVIGPDDEVLHKIEICGNHQIYTPLEDKKYWKSISGRRTADTEKELEKLIKITFKGFRSTIHFIQNDFSGLPTATPEKRKTILKEALTLIIYSKLEKLAKEKYSALSKEMDKNKILLENLGDPANDLNNLTSKLQELALLLEEKQQRLKDLDIQASEKSKSMSDLTSEHAILQNNFATLLEKEKTLSSEKNRLEISVKEYQSKKSNVIKYAKDLIQEINKIKEEQTKLIEKDYHQIDILTEEIGKAKESIAVHNANIQNNLNKYEELKVPLPKDAVCKHCRQNMSERHRKQCLTKINQEMEECQLSIKNSKQEINNLNKFISDKQIIINDLQRSKHRLEDINIKIVEKNKEVQDKKDLHLEYSGLFEKFTSDLKNKELEIEENAKELATSFLDTSKKITRHINELQNQLNIINSNIHSCNKETTHLNANRAVVQHNIDQAIKNKIKQEELVNKSTELFEDGYILPTVIQAFSSTGIPNLIIQNVLDDLQTEANNLLTQLKPGLQLSFSVEKTRDDGTEADTLDILYHVNGKERYYEQLSGAMRLAVTFSLKLGLSFIMQNIVGTDLKFLLLDEIDQSLDKASVDAFADIVKFFQKDYTILVITHNDRLKDKFSHAILVEQDINLISRAKVVSSW